MPDDLLPPPDDDLFDGLVRPSLPPTAAERLRGALEERGLTVGRLAGSTLLAVAALVAAWWLLRPAPAPVESTLPVESAGASAAGGGGPGAATTAPGPASTTTTMTEVVVHAAGAVARPGLYRLPPGARVADLIRAAGGLAADADGNRINLAAPVADGERVFVLHAGEAAVPEAPRGDGGAAPAAVAGGPTAGSSAPAGPVDLNTATADELDTLPGVGPSTAQAIIDYRAQHGRFTSVDDLLDVRGIGDAKLAQLRDRVTV